MRNRSQLSQDRRSLVRKATRLFNSRLKRLQLALYTDLLQILTDLKTDSSGRIRFSQGNIRRGERVTVRVERFNQTRTGSIRQWLVNRFLDVLGLNRLYFKTIDAKADTVEEKARRLIMRRLGYDVGKKEVILGSYIDTITSNQQFAESLSRNVNRAIAGRIPLRDFQQQVRTDISAARAFDIFQQVDRQAGLLYAEELGLQYVIWNNSPKKTTTDFCRERAGNVYSVEEVNEWDSQVWSGKFETGHRSIIDGHGYGCRTSIDFISKELAFRLRPELRNSND